MGKGASCCRKLPATANLTQLDPLPFLIPPYVGMESCAREPGSPSPAQTRTDKVTAARWMAALNNNETRCAKGRGRGGLHTMGYKLWV